MRRAWKCFLLLVVGAAQICRAEATVAPSRNPATDALRVRGGEEFAVAAPAAAVVSALGRGGFEEWEVFLSLDGGRRFPLRLTPHLDADVLRATIRWPHLPSSDARLLVRFGDERDEIDFVLPERFEIEAAGSTAISEPSRGAQGSGDLPLAGTPRIVSWVEGDRRGIVRREVWEGFATLADDTPQLGGAPAENTAFEEADPNAPHLPVSATGSLVRPERRVARRPPPDFAPARTSDRLSLLQRRNE
jgi:hypothetical protein